MIGILGGTFDPIHTGHLRMAWESYEKHHLEEVRFIPCALPVHKKAPLASAKARIAMLKLAIQSCPAFTLDLREIQRKTPSYMIDTLLSLHEELPSKKFGLILGSTELITFTKWHQWEDILSLAKLIIMPRDTASALPISSTYIRKVIQKKLSPRYLLPEKVLDYILSHHLYQSES